MNNQLIVIESGCSNISTQINGLKLEYNNQSKDDDIHRWLIVNKELFREVEKIIIPIRLGDEDAEFMGLYIGLHIRLTKELGNVCFLPIIFLSDDTKDEIFSNQINNFKVKSGLLLFTKGTYLISAFLLDEIIVSEILAIDKQILIKKVLPILNIENSKDLGHQLANEWGAFRLAKFAGFQLKIDKPTTLFFKYKDLLTNNDVIPDQNTNIGVFNEPCNALLIDDNADSGWKEVLQYILVSKIIRPEQKTFLQVIKTFDDAINFKDEEYAKYDIVFLDLRLSKEDEKSNQINDVINFTGTKVLEKIKSINNGIQVIIFTASNKVWNINKLIEKGANGYYIKESPEYLQDEALSKSNYKELIASINECLSLKYLKRIDVIHRKCLISIKKDSEPERLYKYKGFYKSIPSNDIKELISEYRNFHNRAEASFEIANQLLRKSVNNRKYLNLAFLTYFQIIEDYVSQPENFDFVSKSKCYVGLPRIRVIDYSDSKLTWKLTFFQDGINGNYFEIIDQIICKELPPQTLAKVSFVLAFKFNKDNSYLKKWAYLNNIRNTKASHGGNKGYVTSSNIEELLEIIELIFT